MLPERAQGLTAQREGRQLHARACAGPEEIVLACDCLRPECRPVVRTADSGAGASWVQVPAEPVTGFVTLGKSLKHSSASVCPSIKWDIKIAPISGS